MVWLLFTNIQEYLSQKGTNQSKSFTESILNKGSDKKKPLFLPTKHLSSIDTGNPLSYTAYPLTK